MDHCFLAERILTIYALEKPDSIRSLFNVSTAALTASATSMACVSSRMDSVVGLAFAMGGLGLEKRLDGG